VRERFREMKMTFNVNWNFSRDPPPPHAAPVWHTIYNVYNVYTILLCVGRYAGYEWGQKIEQPYKYSLTIVSRDRNPIRFSSNLKLISYTLLPQQHTHTRARAGIEIKFKKENVRQQCTDYMVVILEPYNSWDIIIYTYIRHGKT